VQQAGEITNGFAIPAYFKPPLGRLTAFLHFLAEFGTAGDKLIVGRCPLALVQLNPLCGGLIPISPYAGLFDGEVDQLVELLSVLCAL